MLAVQELTSDIHLTDEQLAVIAGEDPIVKVNAVAGSGKTTTLLEFAARRPRQKVLYLAYNRSVANEVAAKARAKGLTNLTVSTIHSLAFREAHGGSYEIAPDLNEWHLLEAYVPPDRQAGRQGLVFAWLLKDLVNYYLNAASTALDVDLLTGYIAVTTPAETVKALLREHGEELLAQVRSILSDMKHRRLPAVHDFYLKMFQFKKTRLPYEVILVDEAQDTSGVMLEIIGRQDNAQRLLVGDTFQQIYAFRHAVNSLDRIDGTSYRLSQTFRFGDTLAQHLGQRVNDAYELLGDAQTLVIRGTEADTRFGRRALQDRYPLTVIARSNLALFDAVLERLVAGDKAMYFEGGYHSYAFLNSRVVGLLYLQQGRRQRVQDAFISRFRSFDDARRFAKDTQNGSLANMVDLVNRYGGDLFELDKTIKASLVDRKQAQLIFTTTHKAKGQEYDFVQMVENDFATRTNLARLLKAEEVDSPAKRLKEEINLYYVAATRAKHSIRLAPF